jgi:hypothetical protein
MEWILLAVLVLACPLGMGLMMFFMHRGRSGQAGHSEPEPPQERS